MCLATSMSLWKKTAKASSSFGVALPLFPGLFQSNYNAIYISLITSVPPPDDLIVNFRPHDGVVKVGPLRFEKCEDVRDDVLAIAK